MKEIDSLVDDIYNLFLKEGGHKPSPENLEKLGKDIATVIASRMAPAERKATLRLSNLGTPCERKLWYDINTPELGEPLDAPAKIKFLFGDILELLLLFWAREAGHEVTGEQDELVHHGVVGHRDCIIDGRVVDCKSASSYSFKKFAGNELRSNDPFGYLPQLGSYLDASRDDPRVTDKKRGSFLVIDKTLGKITLDTYALSPITQKYVDDKREVVNSNKPPKRGFEDEPEGKSGNRKLGMNCSYCAYKSTCWPGLRGFAYSYGPQYLTWIEREPKVPEISGVTDES